MGLLIVIIEQFLKPHVEDYLSPIAFGTLDTISRPKSEHAIIAVLDLSSLYEQLPGDDVTPSSALISLLDKLTSDRWKQNLGEYSIGFDIDLSSRRSVQGSQVESASQDFNRPIGTTTFAEHQRFVRYVLSKCRNEYANPQIVLGVGLATTSAETAFDLPETGKEPAVSGRELAHLAGSVLTFTDSKCMLESVKQQVAGAKPLLSLGAKIVGNIPATNGKLFAQSIGGYIEKSIERTPGLPQCDITARYVSYAWLKHRDEATFTVDSALKSAVNGQPQFQCDVSTQTEASLFNWVKRNEIAAQIRGDGLLPVILLVGNLHAQTENDEFAVYHLGVSDVELDESSARIAAGELSNNRTMGDFVPGAFESFPGVYQHAAYIDTALNQPLHPMGGFASKIMDYGIAIVVAILMFCLERVFEHEKKLPHGEDESSIMGYIDQDSHDELVIMARCNGIISWLYYSPKRLNDATSNVRNRLFRICLGATIFGPIAAIMAIRGIDIIPKSSLECLICLFVGWHIWHLKNERLNARLMLSSVRLGIAAWLIVISISLCRLGIFWLGYITAIIFILVELYIVIPFDESILKSIDSHFRKNEV